MSLRAIHVASEKASGNTMPRQSRARSGDGTAKMKRLAGPEASSLKTLGVMPTQQARSKATFQALIDAGMRVIESKQFRDINIAEIAQAAEVSVGAFYDRFRNKDVFLAALQEI